MTRRCTRWTLPLAALLALLPIGGALAQNPPSSPPPTMGVPGLTLSPAQQARFDARNEKFRKETQALQADPKLTLAQKQAKFAILFQAVDKDMLAILTPAQRATVQKQRAEAQKQRAAAQSRNAAFAKAHEAQIKQGQALAAQLNKTLTKDQQKRLGAINGTEQAQMQQIGQDASLTPAARQQKAMTVDADAQSKILAVLTSAQRPLFTHMMQIKKDLAAASQASGGH